MKRFVISDNHFWHFNIIKLCDRPFSSTEEMNETMIENWNSVVSNEDVVYNLGDFAYGKGSREHIAETRARLNGKIILILGNHDRQTKTWYQRAGFEEVISDEFIVCPRANHVILSHRKEEVKEYWLNIHGHSHTKGHNDRNHYCVSVENINYTPVDLDELIRSLR